MRSEAVIKTRTSIILVVEDVHETRDGIERLLAADGYQVTVARDETDAIESARFRRPDLILVSLAGSPREVVFSARAIRERSGVGGQVPVVVFCIEAIGEGDEVAIGQNVHITRPDNFNQLRGLLARLLNTNPIAALRQTHATYQSQWNLMSTNQKREKTFSFRFIDASPKVLLELTNSTDRTLKSIEILTVFLKDEDTPGGGPSIAHIRFDGVQSMKPKETAVLSHRTWIDGRPTDADHDQLGRLKIVSGEFSPYVLDISWEEAEGKSRFQSIPVGH